MFRVRAAVTSGVVIIVLWAGGAARLAAQQQPGEALVPTRLSSEPEGASSSASTVGGRPALSFCRIPGSPGKCSVEDQVVDTEYDVARGSGLFRGAMSYRVWRNIGVGLGFTRSAATGMADVNAEVPHPVFVARPRVASSTLTNMAHRENMFLIQGVWMTQLDEQVSVHIFGGTDAHSRRSGGGGGRDHARGRSAVLGRGHHARSCAGDGGERGRVQTSGSTSVISSVPAMGSACSSSTPVGSTDFDLLQGPTSITVGGFAVWRRPSPPPVLAHREGPKARLASRRPYLGYFHRPIVPGGAGRSRLVDPGRPRGSRRSVPR